MVSVVYLVLWVLGSNPTALHIKFYSFKLKRLALSWINISSLKYHLSVTAECWVLVWVRPSDGWLVQEDKPIIRPLNSALAIYTSVNRPLIKDHESLKDMISAWVEKMWPKLRDSCVLTKFLNWKKKLINNKKKIGGVYCRWAQN